MLIVLVHSLLFLSFMISVAKVTIKTDVYKRQDKKIAILSCMDTRLTALLPAALGIKNRFGSTAELGIYEMRQDGLRQVSNPSDVYKRQTYGRSAEFHYFHFSLYC